MGIQNFKFFFESLNRLNCGNDSLILNWNAFNSNTIGEHKIGLYLDSISVLFHHLQFVVNTKEDKEDDEFTDDDFKRIAIEGVKSMLRYIPENVLSCVTKFYISSDSVAPLGKLYTQNKRKQQTSKVIPVNAKMKATTQFCEEILILKQSRGYNFDVHYNHNEFGEGEWKCLRVLYNDLKEHNIDKTFILGNDSDIMLGAFLINNGHQDIYCVKMNLGKNVNENSDSIQSSLYKWKTNESMFKLLYFFMFCLTGNDYIPPILSGTDNQYSTWLDIIYNIRNNVLFPNFKKYVQPLANFIFDNHSVLNDKELITSLTFIITYNAIVLSNIMYKQDIETKFISAWNKLEQSSSDYLNEKRNIFMLAKENGQLPDHILAFENFITSSLWYLCYCTYFMKCNVVSINNDLNTIPQFNFQYNDTRIQKRFEINGAKLRQDLYNNIKTRLYNCYFIIEGLINKD